MTGKKHKANQVFVNFLCTWGRHAFMRVLFPLVYLAASCGRLSLAFLANPCGKDGGYGEGAGGHLLPAALA